MTPKWSCLARVFGGLELSTILSEAFTDGLDLTLIDQSDHFVFGFSKLDVVFGRENPDAVRLAYRNREAWRALRRERITAIDPVARRVTTDAGTYDADVLVVALAPTTTRRDPGLTEVGNEFYSVQGASRLRESSSFSKGHAIVGVTSTPFKCPPAPK